MLAVASRPVAGRSAKAAASWSLDHEYIILGELRGVSRAEMFDRAVGALDPVLAHLRVAATCDTKGSYLAMVRKQHGGHWLEKAHAALDTVATFVTTFAARTTPD